VAAVADTAAEEAVAATEAVGAVGAAGTAAVVVAVAAAIAEAAAAIVEATAVAVAAGAATPTDVACSRLHRPATSAALPPGSRSFRVPRALASPSAPGSPRVVVPRFGQNRAVALLALRGVSVGYRGRPVLDDVSLDVEAGEIVALVGRNGAGKTTLLRAAAGMLRPSAGRVEVDGRDLATLSVREIARCVSGVPQEDAIDLPFTVREVVAMGRLSQLSPWRSESDGDRAAIDAALVAADLVALADRPATTLSGGERRRASLARCLAQDAPVLLLDEPTAHLDLGQEARWLATVRRCANERRRAVLVALHDVNLAAAAADRVALLDDGHLVAIGAPAAVLTAERLSTLFHTPLRVVVDPSDGRPLVVAGSP
jgi:iron complex transport system ATP-binding protein